MPDLTKMYAELEELVESDGDQAKVQELLEAIEVEEAAQLESGIDDDNIAPPAPASIEEEAVQATIPQISPEEDNVTEAEKFGYGKNAQETEVVGVALDEITAVLQQEEGTDKMEIVIPGITKDDDQFAIHVGDTNLGRGEAARLGRGLGLYLAGAVTEDLTVESNTGKTYVIEDGVCHELRQQPQVNSFQQEVAVIERMIPCKGHHVVRNVNRGGEKPQFKDTGKRYNACLHMYAVMIAAGFRFSFSAKAYRDSLVANAAERGGNTEASEWAEAQFAEWRQNSQQRFETRKAVSQAITAEKNRQGIPDDGYLPPAPEFLDAPLGNTTVRNAVLSLNGKRFTLELQFPINTDGEVVTQRVRANSLDELKSRVAPLVATANQNGGKLRALTIETR